MVSTISRTTRIILIVEFIVAIYMLIALTTSEYNSYKVEKYIQDFESRNQEIALENQQLKNEYDYFTSKQYQEKIAKQNFGLVNPGEQVLIIPEESKITDEEEFQNRIITEKVEFYESLSNPIKWWYYLFGDV